MASLAIKRWGGTERLCVRKKMKICSFLIKKVKSLKGENQEQRQRNRRGKEGNFQFKPD